MEELAFEEGSGVLQEGWGGVYDRMAMGEDVRPHGVENGGSRANGVKGGEGSEERPVPPMMAIEMGSVRKKFSVFCQKSGMTEGTDRSRWMVAPPW